MPSAIDTNVLLRIMIDENSEHGARAMARFETGGLIVGPSVLLETEWVLRSRYGLSAQTVNRLMTALVTSPNIQFGNESMVRDAIAAHGDGMDFADALHLFGAAECNEFLTFDKDLTRSAKSYPNAPAVREP
ncbi:type II toxin-antitoxin system VapC family toxin [Allomesorhizobium camelthorni]|uniref:Type II toxin-antitoxin system VapC family toxin n=1 Tax=Allomesorhizobium camelthorni TaxID=475069 RepID=A0A6G4W796_9HYPH|nr:type II toxin-antitoxin system VapC family toxin [Mesorhizobium camelthorni]NGO50040.1 type II toxin-antitoxin system VapC family toxin [Mesorhizobium camelthorni]